MPATRAGMTPGPYRPFRAGNTGIGQNTPHTSANLRHGYPRNRDGVRCHPSRLNALAGTLLARASADRPACTRIWFWFK